MTRFLTGIFIFLLLSASGFSPHAIAQDDEIPVRTPEEILEGMGDIPTVEAIHELFINCSEWDEARADVRDASRQALIDMGHLAVSTLLDEWIEAVDLRRRIELDNIINGIGFDATQYLIPYVEHSDYNVRRHAAYLIGNVAFIKTLEDTEALGLLDEDVPAMDALIAGLEVETDWHATRTFLNAIGQLRDPEQIELLSSYLADDEESVRLGAVLGLGKIPSQDAASRLIRAFSDEEMTVRQAAVLAVSTKTMGNFGFEALIGGSILSPGGTSPRLCALESLWRYLNSIKSDHSDYVWEQRLRAYTTAVSVIDSNLDDSKWQVRGYAIEVIGYTYGGEAGAYLESLLEDESNPFVIGKIEEALNRLDEGMPEEVEE